jgi:hypothetical protein
MLLLFFCLLKITLEIAIPDFCNLTKEGLGLFNFAHFKKYPSHKIVVQAGDRMFWTVFDAVQINCCLHLVD